MLFTWCINFPSWFVIAGTTRREREQSIVKLTQCRNWRFPEDTFFTGVTWCDKGHTTGEQQRTEKPQPGERWRSATESTGLEEISLATNSWDLIQASHQLGWQGLPWHTCSKLAGLGEEQKVHGGHHRYGSIAGKNCSLPRESLLPWLLSGSTKEGKSNGIRTAKPLAKPSRGSPLPFCLLLL